MKATKVIGAATFALYLACGMQAVLADNGMPWNSLSRSEQSVLSKHQGEWSRLSGQEQRRLVSGARKYLELPPEQRKAVEDKQLRDKYSKQKKYR
jgi:hypothetical protein